MANKPKPKKSETEARTVNWIEMLRFGIVGLLAAVGCAALFMYTAAHWVERQILTTDNWVATVAPLPQNPTVSSALSNYVTTQIFTNVPVEQQIKEALPPRAAFLASPLTSQLQSLTNKIANRVITSDNFTTIWTAANRKAMDRLTSNARGQSQTLGAKAEQKFNLDLNDVKSKISDKLGGDTASAIPTLKVNAGKAIAITTDLKAKRDQVWSYIRDIDYLSAVLPFVIFAAFMGALAFANKRRRTVMIIAISSIVLLLLEIITIKQIKQSVLSQVKVSANQPAVGYIYDSLTSSLRNIINTWLAGMVIIFIICLLSGPYRWAVSLRKLMRMDRLKDSTFFVKWYEFRSLSKQYIYYIWLGVGIVTLVWLAFAANVNSRLLSNSVLTALALIAIIYMIANPRKTLTSRTK